jgi:uncharacterized membrane protein YfcA
MRALSLIVPVLLIGVALYTVLSPRMDDGDRHDRVGPRGFLPVAGGVGSMTGSSAPAPGSSTPPPWSPCAAWA